MSDITERKQAKTKLKLFRALLDNSNDAIEILDPVTLRFLEMNATGCRALGYTREEILSMSVYDIDTAYSAAPQKVLAQLQESGHALFETIHRRKDGSTFPVEVNVVSVELDRPYLLAITRDITERKTADAKAQRQANLYAALSQCTKAIMRCTNKEELFEQICRAAVQFGGMKMAWIGLVDNETRMVRPIASFGDHTEYLKGINISVDADNPFGRGPTGTAIRENRVYWSSIFQNNPLTAPWNERAAQAGLVEGAALPLQSKGIVVGAFTLYSGEIGVFDEVERDLLTEMATDIGFALDSFVREFQRKEAEKEINYMNAVLLTQQETSLDAILVIDENGKILSYNQQFIDLWRLPPQLVSAHLDEPVLQAIIDKVKNSEASAARVRYLYEHRDTKSREEILLKDGRIIDRYSAPVIGQNSNYYGRVWYFRDITARQEAEVRIAFLNRVYAVLSGINSLIVRVSDRDELFSEACRIAVEVSGFGMAMISIVDQSTMTIIPVASAGKDQELINAVKNTLLSSELASITMVARAIKEKKPIISNDSKNDPQLVLSKKYAKAGVRSISLLPLIVSDEAIGVFALYASERNFFQEEEMKLLTELASDISFAIDHIRKQERLNYLAYYDVLTGLANRSLFLERVAEYMRSAVIGGHRLAIALIDLEHFKSINDSLGRLAGDALLRQVAALLTHKMGDASLLARMDADHFAIVVPKVESDGNLVTLVEDLMGAFQEYPFRLDNATFRISIKVGIALFPDDGKDADTLFKNAEAALKTSKASGEQKMFYTHKMTEEAAEKLILENKLRLAIEREEFVLHYQPKVNFMTGKVTGAEALIRWNDPHTGLVPPDKFIPTLEETGLISEVGRWVLQRAIADYLRWRSAGLAVVRIAVNVSPRQLRNLNFIAEIKQAIAIDAHAPDGLELEITESLIMADIENSITSLQAIHAMGVSIAIDDFGTGFSSLSYLSKLPVNTLKIDRSFVSGMTTEPEGLAMVSTIINLAHSLKLKVVAEGVETEEQSRLLRLLRCDEMQGFLFSKSVPSDIFETKFLAG